MKPRRHIPLAPVPTRRNPTRTAKHKGVSRIQMHMDSCQSYEPDPIAAMHSRLKQQLGMSSGLSPQTSSCLLVDITERWL